MAMTPCALAGNGDDLAAAIELFDAGDYLAAQEILVGMDQSKLTDERKRQRDDYLNRIQVAITMFDKATRDLETAKLAIDEGDATEALDLLERVLANEYAPAPLKKSAESYKRELLASQVTPEPTGQPQVVATEPPPAREPDGGEDMERARVLVGEGQEMAAAGRHDEAGRLYEQALGLVPGYPAAIDGLDRLAQHEENVLGSRSESLLDRMKRLDAINWQRSETEYRNVERSIRDHVQANRFDEAQQSVLRARQIVESGKQYADPSTDYDRLRAEMDALVRYVNEQERDYNERKVAEIRAQIRDQRTDRMRRVEENRRREVDALMDQAKQHRKDGDLKAAINVLKRVIVIDPKDDRARWWLDELDELNNYRRGRRLRESMYRESQRALLEVEEAKIPWADQLRYPADWPELILRPERNPPGATPRDNLLIGALDRPVDVDFLQVPFGQVIQRFVDSQRINIYVNWHDLKTAGLNRDVPIELSLPNRITLKKALTEVLEQAGTRETPLGYEVADGVITIATQDYLDRKTFPVVYDITDLLMEIPQFVNAPTSDLEAMRRRERAAAVDRPLRFGDDDDDESEYDPRRQSRVDRIIELIETTVAPQSWRNRDGTIGTIQEINGQLVITQNSASHQQVRDLLSKLREQRSIQVSVEARFLTVSSHYLEELGMDLDIVLNQSGAGFDFIPTGIASTPITTDSVLGSALLLPRSFSQLGFGPAVPGRGTAFTGVAGTPLAINQPFGNAVLVPARGGGGVISSGRATPIPIRGNALGFTNPAGLEGDIPGTFAGNDIGPVLGIFGSFLDSIQVDFLIRATQADSRTTILTAPRLVLMNGQRSWVAVTIQTNFVSSLIPQVNVAAAAQAPVTQTINAGAVLDVTATVTADKRYVTMTLRPGVTRLISLTTFQTSGGGTAGDAFIQLPELQSQLVRTTVSIPDGGTLLIGGQKLASETEVEAGVPILSKIPLLKRAYSSRAMIKDEQTLLILVKPTIFIQSEQEELAFPSFGQG